MHISRTGALVTLFSVLAPTAVWAQDGAIEVYAVLYNFPDSHPDFDLPHGGRVSGNVADYFGPHRPVWQGGGRVLLSEFTDDVGHEIPPHVYQESGGCVDATGDVAGAFGALSSGDVQAFDEWFRFIPGVNESELLSMVVTERNGSASFNDTTNFNFMPAGAGDSSFTISLHLAFKYDACQNQCIQVFSDGDVFAFLDHELIIDCQQRGALTQQFIALDRLGLTSGTVYKLQFFFASRSPGSHFGFQLCHVSPWQDEPPIDPDGAFD